MLTIVRSLSLVSLLGLAGAATQVAFDWFPDLQRDPEIQLSATLRTVVVEPDVTHGDYLLRTSQTSRFEAAPMELRRVTGSLFYVEIDAKGLKRREGELRWCLHDAETGRRLHAYACELRQRISPGTTSDRFIVPLWVQPPVDEGQFVVRFQFRAKGVLLALLDSPPFGPCRQRSCGAPEAW